MATQHSFSRVSLADGLREARSLVLVCVAVLAVTCIGGWTYSSIFVSVRDASNAPEAGMLLAVAVCVELAFVGATAIVVLNIGRVLSARSVTRAWPIMAAGTLVAVGLVAPSEGTLEAFLIAGPLPILSLATTALCVVHDRRVAREADVSRSG
jgi:hypothetical protein